MLKWEVRTHVHTRSGPGGGGRDVLRALWFGAEPSAQAPWGPSWPTTASTTACTFLGLPDLRLQCPETRLWSLEILEDVGIWSLTCPAYFRVDEASVFITEVAGHLFL